MCDEGGCISGFHLRCNCSNSLATSVSKVSKLKTIPGNFLVRRCHRKMTELFAQKFVQKIDKIQFLFEKPMLCMIRTTKKYNGIVPVRGMRHHRSFREKQLLYFKTCWINFVENFKSFNLYLKYFSIKATVRMIQRGKMMMTMQPLGHPSFLISLQGEQTVLLQNLFHNFCRKFKGLSLLFEAFFNKIDILSGKLEKIQWLLSKRKDHYVFKSTSRIDE